METINIVNAALAGDKESFMTAFNAAISNRVVDALEVKKVELASNLLGIEEQPNEIETTDAEAGQPEVVTDGSAASTATTEA